MSWQQDLTPIDPDLQSSYSFNPDLETMSDSNLFEEPTPMLTLEQCKEQFQSRTDYLSEHYTSGFCKVTFDTVLCWPPTPVNESAVVKCFAELNMIKYDDTRKFFCTCKPFIYFLNICWMAQHVSHG
ncbi:hypothetical protein JTB14_030835 [Gonioctena quinquepunctata]|nr:hypothetical protein JTB14_030835 [Gonioctena quinquepunctata]